MPALTVGVAVLALAVPGVASAADRAVRLTAEPSMAPCTGFDSLDCSYLSVRNALVAAPTPSGTEPTFINLAKLPGDSTIDAVIHDDGSVSVAQGDVVFPAVETVKTSLAGQVTVKAQIIQTGAWTGTFDDATGAMSLNAPLSLRFTLNCDPVNGLCALLDPAGNLGTWTVDPKKAAVLSTGHSDALAPPAVYGSTWVPAVAEDGAPFDAATGALTLVDNRLELERLDASDCEGSPVCTGGLVGLVAGQINPSIGADATRDSVPGAIDMRMTFGMDDALLKATPSAVDFGSQALGTAGSARNVDISALVDQDVELLSLHTDRGEDADFFVSAGGCRGAVPAKGTCTAKVRFVPSDSGTRASALYARVKDPSDPTKTITLQLAALSGRGGELPQGPAGPKGDAGASAAQSASTSAAPLIRRGKSRVRLSSKSIARIATIKCATGTCKITSRSARLKIGGKNHTVAVTGTRMIAKGRTATVGVFVRKAVRKALKRHGKGTLTVKFVVRSPDGRSTAKTISLQLLAR